LKLANGVLRNRVRSGETLPDAIAYANRALDRRGLKAFNEHNPIERNQAVEMTLRVSERSLASPRIVPKFNLPDLPHPALIRTLEGHSSYVTGCAFSPDGKLIVSASSDRTLKVWDSETGRILATFFADGPMFCCVFYGEMIVAGGARGVYFLRLVR
jgi:WD40 repeat protein